MNPARAARLAMLFVIEGPRRPWWLPLAMIASPIVWTALTGDDGILLIAALVCAGIGMWWCYARFSQYRYYESIAAHRDVHKCPICGYNLRGLPEPRCPECGTRADEYIARARRATSKPRQ